MIPENGDNLQMKNAIADLLVPVPGEVYDVPERGSCITIERTPSEQGEMSVVYSCLAGEYNMALELWQKYIRMGHIVYDSRSR
jgi:hypothetical protein